MQVRGSNHSNLALIGTLQNHRFQATRDESGDLTGFLAASIGFFWLQSEQVQYLYAHWR